MSFYDELSADQAQQDAIRASMAAFMERERAKKACLECGGNCDELLHAMREHDKAARIIEKCKFELATNFECPSERILGVYGAQLRLDSKAMLKLIERYNNQHHAAQNPAPVIEQTAQVDMFDEWLRETLNYGMYAQVRQTFFK